METGSSESLTEVDGMEAQLSLIPVMKSSHKNLIYIPPFSAKNNVILDQVGVLSSNDPSSKGLQYEIRVRWTEDSIETLKRYNELTGNAAIFYDPNDNEDFRMVQCDGPCGLIHYADDMHQFGNCEHNICPTCYEFEDSQPLFDGTSGCSNKCCYESQKNLPITTSKSINTDGSVNTSKSSLIPLQKTSETSVVLSESELCAGELLIIMMKGFRKEKGELVEEKYDMEMSSLTTVNNFILSVNKFFPSLDKCSIYYSTGQLKTRSELKVLDLSNTKDRRLIHLTNGDNYLNIIVTYPNVSVLIEPRPNMNL